MRLRGPLEYTQSQFCFLNKIVTMQLKKEM